MRKVIFIMLFLLLNNYISSQDFGLSTKYSINVGNSYDSYGSLSLGGVLTLFENKIEIGSTFGTIYSEPTIDFDFNIPEYYHIDVIDIAKVFIGASLYYYPVSYKSTYSPFIGISGKFLYKGGMFSQFMKSGSNNIMDPGLFSFITKDDMIISISTGLKILIAKGFNAIIELEYQHREFILEYDEYDASPIGWGIVVIKEHSQEQIINAFNFGIGLHFVF